MKQIANNSRRTLVLTGASRGIGHATVKRFSSAGWRVITCSRQAFPEDCPWEVGPEDHLQIRKTLHKILYVPFRFEFSGSQIIYFSHHA